MKLAKTMFDKIWDFHVVLQEEGAPAVLYIDMHLIHEVTSPQAFDELRARNLPVWDVNRIKGTIDHCNSTILGEDGTERGSFAFSEPTAVTQIRQMEKNCAEFGIELFGLDDPSRGVIHVFGPDMGLTQPGMTIVCGDSHTATHGAFGALSFGIGTSEVGHVMGTQCLLQKKPQTMRINYIGKLPTGTSAKDIILYTIAQIGVAGGTNYAIEFAGEAIEELSMEGRMTLCNMAIEAGARTGMVAPDEKTFAWLRGKKFAPNTDEWEAAVARWKQIATDNGAIFDREITLDISQLSPMVTYGTNPGMSISIDGVIPPLEEMDDNEKTIAQKALRYMEFQPGEVMRGKKIDYVFIGSCTNGRISDLREAAMILKHHIIAEDVTMIVVPGSGAVKYQAEAEGLNRIFIQAGAEWREPGCSMCLSMNGDIVPAGKLCVSTSNRNFEGRQGQGARTILVSPATAAASAIEGKIADPREYLARRKDY